MTPDSVIINQTQLKHLNSLSLWAHCEKECYNKHKKESCCPHVLLWLHRQVKPQIRNHLSQTAPALQWRTAHCWGRTQWWSAYPSALSGLHHQTRPDSHYPPSERTKEEKCFTSIGNLGNSLRVLSRRAEKETNVQLTRLSSIFSTGRWSERVRDCIQSTAMTFP